ncbi:RNA polymerase sigma-70 factor (ECF subfamily) [Novosphingobium sp. PhB165]|uniref:RNA polymerase sigma factor n=1 Tax=Novosphingobium sp. PhB165 TaxID=2485105 RepID=UPI001048E1DF|nr:sigma-70 family RNA polymerase sigma factor [Novosphingobium sp. PhB165]TCM20899.1 RNA polymerase sigma-70 factor (ECF subfamily) [Novosphingobium sp. PhB165]
MTSLGQEVPAEGGLRQLSLAMRGELRRFLLARRVSEADAEDVLQDLFIRLETSVTGPVRSPRAYLYQMVNNMAHTRRRTETRRQARDAGWIEVRPDARTGTGTGTGTHGRGDAAEEQADAAPDPETALVARDQLARVEARLAELPERTAHIFRQFRVEGASQKDIAIEQGISLSAVEKHLQRAYRAVLEIRNRLEDTPPTTGMTGPAEMTGGFDGSSR